ncbi:hypothetical protein BK734_00030 [Bacillus thuringiensis serovar kim]|nr:hypothetical protein BK734_00030 [Bacillus thuringiensis serovar kim]
MNQSNSKAYRLGNTKCDAKHDILIKQIKMPEGNFICLFLRSVSWLRKRLWTDAKHSGQEVPQGKIRLKTIHSACRACFWFKRSENQK